jgi:hypothetical protein
MWPHTFCRALFKAVQLRSKGLAFLNFTTQFELRTGRVDGKLTDACESAWQKNIN